VILGQDMAARNLPLEKIPDEDLPGDEKFREKRLEMVEMQVRRRGISSSGVLAAMREVPRHEFVPLEDREMAYADKPLPIGNGQTISQPLIVAVMASALELTGIERVLDVGTGSGYNTAILSHLAQDVFSIEWHTKLAEEAQERLKSLGYENVHVIAADGAEGWPEDSLFDAISVAAAVPAIPPPLLEQLKEGGRLVIPVGSIDTQELLQVIRYPGGDVQQALCPCRFVPLIGRYGFSMAPER